MKIRTLTWLLGTGVAIASAGAQLAACSSSSGGLPSNPDSGGGAQGGANAGSAGGAGGGGGSGGSGGSGCKSDPTLHPGTAGSIFCGYNDAGSFDCTTGNQCCLGGRDSTQPSGYAPENCAAFGATCTNGTGPLPIECEQPQDCVANGQAGAACCLQGGASTPAPVAGCDAQDLKSSGGSGIICEGASTGDAGASDGGASDAGAAGCAAGELQVCEAPGDCPSGKTCTPTRWKLYEIGVCL